MQASPFLAAPAVTFAPFPAATGAMPRLRRSADHSTGVPPAADTVIRARLLASLALLPGWLPDTSNVFVQDGVVILQGLFRRQGDRLAARQAARRVPGVRAVRDDRTRAREWQAMA